MSIGVVSGSFDPITLGHLHVIKEARKVCDEVIIFVANNPDKKYMFEFGERNQLVAEALVEEFGYDSAINIQYLSSGEFTASAASDLGANVIFRGLRNVVDFEYEHGMQMVNHAIEPNITTVFVMPPTELIAVSSSMIKGMIGIRGWDSVAKKYVPKCVLKALKRKVKNG